MAEGSRVEAFEKSIDNGQPIELYRFSQGDLDYFYTSNYEDVSIRIQDGEKIRTEKYFADHVSRAEIRPNTSGSSAVDMQITMWKDHPVAKLFQGAPPESSVAVKIYRVHAGDIERYDVVFYGMISQATFEDSECRLTAKMENWLDKEIPRGRYQYFCQNSIFDANCMLNKEDWQVKVFIDKVDEVRIYCEQFAEYPDGYFDGGCVYYDKQARRVDSHKGNVVTIRYPFLRPPRNEAVITPNCNHLFSVCAERFQNALNFTGFPYVPPTDPEKNPTGQGAYWLDSEVVARDTDGFVGKITL